MVIGEAKRCTGQGWSNKIICRQEEARVGDPEQWTERQKYRGKEAEEQQSMDTGRQRWKCRG